MECRTSEILELTEREQRFLKRIASKYGNARRKPLLQSLVIVTALVVAGHLIERSAIPWWAAFPLVYIPTIILFGRYRKFGVFKSSLMRKLALREANRTDANKQERANA